MIVLFYFSIVYLGILSFDREKGKYFLGCTMFYLNTEMKELLSIFQPSEFSVTELRDFLLEQYDGRNPHESKNFIYRQVRRLHLNGFLQKEGTLYSKKIRYRVTPKLKQLLAIEQNQPRVDCAKKTKIELTKLLNRYQVEMNAKVAETQEYKQLLSKYTGLKCSLDEKHRLTFQESSCLIGKIKAIEYALSELG